MNSISQKQNNNVPIYDGDCCTLYVEGLEQTEIDVSKLLSFNSIFSHVSEIIESVKKNQSIDFNCKDNFDNNNRTFQFRDGKEIGLDAMVTPYCGYKAIYKYNQKQDVRQHMAFSASTAASSEDTCYNQTCKNVKQVFTAEELWFLYVQRCDDLFVFPEDILSCMDDSCMSPKMKKKYMQIPKYGVKLNYGDMYTIGSMPFGGHRLSDPQTIELDRFGRMLNNQWQQYGRPYINKESQEICYYG